MQALVSIIIPAYNSGAYLSESIKSALCQTWANKEVIVIDDHSTDDTLSVMDSFGDAIIKIANQKNLGSSGARNAGLAAAKGNYIQFLDADDLLGHDKIEKQMALLNGATNLLAICKTAHFYHGDKHADSKPLQSWFDADFDNPIDFLLKLYAGDEILPGFGGMVPLHAWLSPTAVVKEAGLWNEDISVDDDGEFFCRVLLASNGIKYSDDALCYYRKYNNGGSQSAQKGRVAVRSTIKAADLKYHHLKAKSNSQMIDRIFARHYWWTGVLAYPMFKDLSKYCIKKAKKLGYIGEKYVGGPAGHKLTKLFGWQVARYIAYYRSNSKKS